MTGGKQPPRGRSMGAGTAGKGKLAKGAPPDEGTLVGNKRPPYDVTGIDALSPLLEYVQFPASRDMITSRIGHVEVPVDKRHTRTVREVLEKVAPTQFQSPRDVETALQRAWNQIATPEGRGRGSHGPPDELPGRHGNP